MDVEAGQWKSARLKLLPKNTTLHISASSKEIVSVLVLNEKSFLRLPTVQNPLFQDAINKNLTFSIRIPNIDNYYLVIDNRKGKNHASVHFDIEALYVETTGNDAKFQQKIEAGSFSEQLSKIPAELEKLFIFTPFSIYTKSCGTANFTATSEGVTLCIEFIQKLTKNLSSKEKTEEVLLFALLHEVCHILLQQWDYPFYDNEEVADEFAAILLIMMNKQESLSSTAEYFLSSPPANEIMAKKLNDDRHPFSMQRARNILRYIKDKDRVRRWRKFLVPHLQTPVLEKLMTSSQKNIDKEAIKRELTRRYSPPPI